MLNAGAKSFLYKNIEVDILEKAIHTVMNNQFFIETGDKKFEVFDFPSGNKEKAFPSNQLELTERQKEFLLLCVSNSTYKEIAEQMHIGIKTVENHRDVLFNKLNVNNRTALVIFAIQNGLTDILS
jgi:DNA-binding NarL/FixJ family response regulator